MRIIILSIFFLTSIVGYSEPLNVEDKLKSLEFSIQKISHVNDSLVKVNAKIVEKSDYNEKLLERYDKLNNTLFSWAGWLIAIFGFVVPVIGYLFVLFSTKKERKEAQKHLDESKEFLNSIKYEMDDLFDKHQRKSRNKLIDDVLKSLEEKDEARRIDSMAFLEAHKHEGFNDGQVIRIIKLFKEEGKANMNAHGYNFLLGSLLYTNSIFIDELFADLIKDGNSAFDIHYFKYIVTYFGKYSKVKYLDDIAKCLIKNNRIINTIQDLELYTSFLKELLINEYLASNMTDNEMKYAQNWKKAKNFVKE